MVKNTPDDELKYKTINERIKYFLGDEVVVERVNEISLLNKLNHKIIAYAGDKPPYLLYRIKHEQIFNLDYDTNADDGWEYHRIKALIAKRSLEGNRDKIKAKLSKIKTELSGKYNKAYIFGTGPSLEKAADLTWDDGIRIVSNTIVKDKELWKHLNPHFIVAGDAIYHYGISDFAKAFRKDLADRLAETDTYFVFQEHFYPFVSQHFPQFIDKLIPIPVRSSLTIHDIIEKKFELPAVGNVLNNILLPLGCYLSDNIGLWGFDGRSPTDKLFWKNSDKQFYTDLVPQLQKMHPAFFEVLVPKDDPAKYANTLHGDLLNNLLTNAEQHNKVFKMLHKSHTKTLMDRYEPIAEGY